MLSNPPRRTPEEILQSHNDTEERRLRIEREEEKGPLSPARDGEADAKQPPVRKHLIEQAQRRIETGDGYRSEHVANATTAQLLDELLELCDENDKLVQTDHIKRMDGEK